MQGMSGSSRIKTKKTFPDLRINMPTNAGGRFSGLLTGLTTATAMRQLNRTNAMNDLQMALQFKALEQKGHKAADTTKTWVSVLNSTNNRISRMNTAILKNNAQYNLNQSLIPEMSLNEVMSSGGKINFPQVGSGLTPAQPQRSFFGKARDWLKGVTGLAEGGIVDRPTMAMMGEGGEREFVVPESKLDPAMQSKLEGILGQPGGERASNGQAAPNSGPSTEDLIATLDDYGPEDVDQAIEDLIALDQELNKPGLQLPDTVDYNAFAQAFIQKFGEEAFRKLEARANGM